MNDNQLLPYPPFSLKEFIAKQYPQDSLRIISEEEGQTAYLHTINDLSGKLIYGRILWRIRKDTAWNETAVREMNEFRNKMAPAPDFAILVLGAVQFPEFSSLSIRHDVLVCLERLAEGTAKFLRAHLVTMHASKMLRFYRVEQFDGLLAYAFEGTLSTRLEQLADMVQSIRDDLLSEKPKYPMDREYDLATLLAQIGRCYDELQTASRSTLPKSEPLSKLVLDDRLSVIRKVLK